MTKSFTLVLAFALASALAFISGFLTAQVSSVVIDVPVHGGPADRSGSDLENVLASLWESYRQAGQLGTALDLVEIEIIPGSSDAIRTRWSLSKSSPVFIDSVVVLGGDRAVRRAVSRLLIPMRSRAASDLSVAQASRILSPYAFIPQGERLRYATYGNRRVAMVVPVRNLSHNRVMGMAGFQPRAGQTAGEVTGEITLHLERLFGTASRSDISWVRTDETSQAFSLSHEEVYLWTFNFGAKFGFQQDLIDGLYLSRSTELAIVAPWSPWGKWSVGSERKRVTAASLGDEHRVQSIFVTNERDFRDAFPNPSRGGLIEARASAGMQSRPGDRTALLLRFSLRTEMVKTLSGRWTFALGGAGGYVHLAGGGFLPPSELFRYGGASTLRGYRENQFSSRAMAVVQAEWRYRLQGDNRITLFMDGAVPPGSFPMPLSAGAGIQQKTPLGILRLEYAVGREDTLQQGKIHIRLIGTF